MINVFHTIACMNNWRQVIKEQLSLLGKHSSIIKSYTYFIGANENISIKDKNEIISYINNLLKENKIPASRILALASLDQYEFPAMQHIAYRRHQLQDDDLLLYFHTKGVSKPKDIRSQKWRAFMDMTMLEFLDIRYSEMEKKPHIDTNGTGWSDWQGIEHYSGNYWLARARYIKTLPSFYDYNKTKRANFEGGDKDFRFNAEFWIGSASEKPKVLSQFVRNTHWPWYDAQTWDAQIAFYRSQQLSIRNR